MTKDDSIDVAVVGGGPAGLQASLVLGRMRRSVVLLDTGAPANAVSDAMHAFLSRDGTPPAEVRRIAAGQLAPYESVERRAAAAVAARVVPAGFEIDVDDGTTITAGHLLLAHGMRYGLPGVEGVAELWGERVFHCPYCHGWEVRDRPVAVLGGTDRSAHQAGLLRSLSDDVELVEEPVERLVGTDAGLSIEFASGRAPLHRHALFIQPELSLASDLADALGAELAGGIRIGTDAMGLTSVPGLYAAGDASEQVQSVAVATGSGARAAYAINAELAAR